ncbi:hypothetical protein COU59_02330 [Candidatus Pacearchaeota archaeon CG10_big_fil_rev_8_21_14_0_10_34_12]|nr:MAG: hypothetical protein COU59_02330 [Candidatus Pacearchaeota archaeon CG10_big_fil_rev_8_21_14_0_10_34_12]
MKKTLPLLTAGIILISSMGLEGCSGDYDFKGEYRGYECCNDVSCSNQLLMGEDSCPDEEYLRRRPFLPFF